MSVYKIVTDRIIEQMQQGRIPWIKPWSGVASGAFSGATGKPYSLLNQMLLGQDGEYLTIKQVNDRGGKVKKGSKSKIVVYWKVLEKPITNADGQTVMDDKGFPKFKGIPFLRYYSVFHIDDCEGVKTKDWKVADTHAMPDGDTQGVFDGYIQRSGVSVKYVKGDSASYSPLHDRIKMPLMEQFPNTEEYYSTLFHEAVHSTGHKSRLARFEDGVGSGMFGSESYSREELVAEIGACALLNQMGMETQSSFRNSAAYIQSWMRALQNDTKLIVAAAGRAEKAVKLIRGDEIKGIDINEDEAA